MFSKYLCFALFCLLDFDRQYNVVSVIGLGSSREAVMSSSLLSLFKIPHIATWATSDELSDKTRFEYFMRVLPPDRFQVRDAYNADLI